MSLLRHQLRKIQDEHQSSRQEVFFMSKELSDAVTVRDKTMADLHTSRLETDVVKKQLDEALAQLSLRESQRKMSAGLVKNEQVNIGLMT